MADEIVSTKVYKVKMYDSNSTEKADDYCLFRHFGKRNYAKFSSIMLTGWT